MPTAALRRLVVATSLGALAAGGLVALPAVASDGPADAVRITEFAYGGLITGASAGGDGEYVEVTNVGRTPVDLTGWSYGTAAAPGTVSLSGFGTLAPGESGIVTDVTPAEFRAEWGLTDAVPVVNDGATTINKGPKTISVFDASGATSDSVTYASGFLPAKGLSAWVDAAHLGAQGGTTGWTVSTAGDQEASWTSATGAVGSPGISSLASLSTAAPRVAFTEFAYGGLVSGSSAGGDGEYVEVTNVGRTPVDLTGWSYGTAAAPGTVSLTGFGSLAPGESGIVTDLTPAEFRAEWGLTDAVPVVNDGTTTINKGPKTISVFDASGATADSVSYASGFLSAKGLSAWVDAAHLGAQGGTTGWTVSTAGDQEASWTSATGAVGSPGISSYGIRTAASVRTTIPGGGGSTPPEAACQTEDSGTAPGTVPAGALAWPGSATPATIDDACAWVTTESGQDLSGLAFDPNDENVLYAVKNKSHVYRLVRSGADAWVKDTANDWAAGKDIRFPGGAGLPDSEGVAVGPDGSLYITTERDNAASSVPLDSILRFDPAASGTTLTAADQWVLTSDVGYAPSDSADANLGFEGVAYVPDSFLVGHGFRTDAGALYDPADYPGKTADGLFFAAVEKTGHLLAYALDADHSFVRVADVASGLVGVMDASFDADLGRIWAHCDNTCGNATTLLGIGTDGHFAVDATYLRPANLPNYNLEGFAVAPRSTAVDGQRQVLWTDDGNRFGHSLWAGTLPVVLTAPVVTGWSETPAPTTVATSATFSWTVDDADATSSVSLDGGVPTAATGTSATFAGLGLGAHTVSVSATDGGLTGEPLTYSWTVVAAPTLSVTKTLLNADSTQVRFSWTTTGSSLTATLDGKAVTVSGTSYTAKVAYGAHAFTILATDTHGNSTPVQTFRWAASDKTAPVLTRVAAGYSSLDRAAYVAYSVSEKSTVTVTFDGRSKVVSSTVTVIGVDGLKLGRHTFTLTAKDAAGNVSAPLTYSFTITKVVTAGSIPSTHLAKGVRAGSSKADIQKVQLALGLPDDVRYGVYDATTSAHVRKWQKTHHLYVTGVVNALTWKSLVDHVADGSGNRVVTRSSISARTLQVGVRAGAKGQAVVDIQRLLKIAETGTFDARTVKAVKAFQKKHHLAANGVVHAGTWARLVH